MTTKPSARLRETEIRPDELYDETMRVHELDRQFLMARAERFVEVACPACGEASARPRFEKAGFRYVDCTRCTTMYVSPRPSLELLHEFYAASLNYKHWNETVFPASAEVRRHKIFVPRVQRVLDICKRLGVTTGTLLEVGAGFGLFCEEMKKTGFFQRVVAVEPTPHLAAHCRSIGLDVEEKPIEKVDMQGQRPSVVASFEVVEHLFSPRAFIEACVQNLAPGGLLVLSCPAVSGFDVVVLGPVTETVDFEHLNYFSPKSLGGLLQACGLEVVETSTPGKLDADIVRRHVLAGRADLRGQPFLQQVLIDEWDRVGDAFQAFLAEQGLSSHLWIVARKP